jgi:dTDP-4-dehydrorhamnose 3,5-epimerase
VSKNGTGSVTRSPATSVPVFLSRIHRSPAFVSYGRARVVLYDGREDSPTHGVVNEFRFGTIRPAMIHIPPRVWHGVQNVGDEVAILVNIVDRAYDYEDPDHWRVPADSPEIPFRF